MPKDKSFTLRVDEKTHEKLRAIAKRDDRTIANLVRRAVEKMISEEAPMAASVASQ